MKRRQYLDRKPTVAPWNGSIPTHWDEKPLFAMARERKVKNRGMKEDNLLSLSYGNIVRKDINTPNGLLPESFETYQIVEPDDVVFRLTDLQNDKRSLRSAICSERGIITSAYLAVSVEGILPAFMSYLMRAYDVQKVFYSMGGGLRQSLGYEDLRRMSIVAPDMEEQASIVRFLDRETARIDGLIEKKARFIDLLKEKSAAVIDHAVTKGLRLDVPMKSSGVEWLGAVPHHWNISRLRFKVKLNPSANEQGKAKPHDETSFFPMDSIGETGGLNHSQTRRYDEVQTGYSYFAENDVTVAKVTPCFENGKGAKMTGLIEGFGYGTTEVTTLRAGADLEADFLYFITMTTPFRRIGVSYMTGAGGLKRVPDDYIRNFLWCFPARSEQREICEYLSAEIGKIETLITKTQHSIDLLREKRAALITAAVTGKIDVRNAA